MRSNQATLYKHSEYLFFGTPIDGRMFNGEKYRFGFNGKELDNEIQDDGNAYDFGARIYDSRLGRWLSLDPLMAKYLGMSPYNFCGNDPVIFVDYDGKDYGVIINHATKTITIVANIYTIKKDMVAVQGGADYWESQSGKFSYEFYNGDKLEQYTINFQINVVQVKTETIAKLKAENDPNGNSMIVQPDNSDELYNETLNGKKIYASCVVRGGLFGNVSESYKYLRTMSHEMGHFFKLPHFYKGLMTDTYEENERSNTKGMVKGILARGNFDTGSFDYDDRPTDESRNDYMKAKLSGARQANTRSTIVGDDSKFDYQGEIKENLKEE